MSKTTQICTFSLDTMLFGIDVANVQEVIRYQEMTAIPLASSVVSGLINLRGQIVTAIDMRARLGISARTRDDLPMNVVICTRDGVVSLLVDQIGDVLEVDESVYERAPETLTGTFRELVRGVYKLEGPLLLVLDAEKIAVLGTAMRPERAA